jgi:Na+/H+-dicarboxylate symporter
MSLNIQIFLGACLGVTIGILLKFLGNESAVSYWTLYAVQMLGGIFIDLLKMILMPLIFTSITVGIANLRAHHQINRIWKITLLYFLGTPIIAALLGIWMVHAVHLGKGLDVALFHDQLSSFNAESVTPSKFIQQFLSGLFMNPFSAMASGNVLAVVMFAVLFGVALIVMGEKGNATLKVMNEIFDITMLMVKWIMFLAPIGIMALLIKLIALQDVSLFPVLGKFMLVVSGITLFHGLVILPGILFLITRISPLRFFTAMRDALLMAFTTSSSSATLPVTLRCVTENLKVDKSIAQFVCPLGATVNMDGTAMYEAVAALFVANLMGIDLNIVQQFIVVATSVLASIGAPGIPSAGMVTMIMVLQSVGLPIEAIAILLPIDRPLDTIRTVVNVEGDGVGSLIVQKLSSSA